MDYKQITRNLHNEVNSNIQQNQLINLNKQDMVSENNRFAPVENIQSQKQNRVFEGFEVVEKEQSAQIISDFVKAQRTENKKNNLPSVGENALNQFKDLYKILEENRDEADKTHTYLPMVTACWRVIDEWNIQGGKETKKNIETLKNAAKAYIDTHKGYTFTSRGRRRKQIAKNIFEKTINVENDVILGNELDSKVVEKVDISQIIAEHPEERKMEDKHVNVDADEIIRKYDTVTKQRMDNDENVEMINTYTTSQQVQELRINDLYKWGKAYANMKAVIPEFKEMIATFGDIMKELVIPASVRLATDSSLQYKDLSNTLNIKVDQMKLNAMACVENLKDKNSIMKKDKELISGLVTKLVSNDFFNMIRAEVLTSRANNVSEAPMIQNSLKSLKLASGGKESEDAKKNEALVRENVSENKEYYDKLILTEVRKDMFDITLKKAQIDADAKFVDNEDAYSEKRIRLYKEISWKKEEEVNRVLRLGGITKEKFSQSVILEYAKNIRKIIDDTWNTEEDRFASIIKRGNHDTRIENSHFNSPNEYEANLKDFIEYNKDMDNVSLIQKMDDVGILAEEFEKPDAKLLSEVVKVGSASEKTKLAKKHEKNLSVRMTYINSLLGNYRAQSDQSLDAMIRRYRGNRYDKSYLGARSLKQ